MTNLRVVRGDATAEELAAVVALLAASGGSPVEQPAAAPSLWARPQLRAPLAAPGPGTWVASGLGL
jgi:hypothetical protein